MNDWRQRDLADLFDAADFEPWPILVDDGAVHRSTTANMAFVVTAAMVLAKSKGELLNAAEAYLEHDAAFVELLEALTDAEALFSAHAEILAEARVRLMMASAKIVFSERQD